MDGTLEVALLLALPGVGAAVALGLRDGKRILTATCAWVAAWAAVVFVAAGRVLRDGALEAASPWFALDALSAYHLAVMAVVFALSSLFARSYFAREIDGGALPLRIARRFGVLWAAAVAAMTIVFLSNNLGVMWVGVELTTLATAFLIRLHVTRESLEATWKYLVICSVGVALAFMGVVLVAASARGVLPSSEDATQWRSLVQVASSLDPNLAKAGFLFVLVGFGTKAGLSPMHTWLPDAHSQAPAPVSAVFSGALLNAALYCVMRYLPIVEGATGRAGWAPAVLVVFGLASILLAGAFILFQKDMKRMLAYSSVEHMGIIALGLGLGPAGTFAALFHAFNHSASKSVGFFAAGRLGQIAGSHDIATLGGAAARAPLWRGALVASVLSLIGVAPFAVFLSEFLVVQAAVAAGAWLVVVLFLLGTGVVFAGALRHITALGWGGAPPDSPPAPRPSASEVAVVVVPLAALLVLGVAMPAFFRDALDQAARVLGGAL